MLDVLIHSCRNQSRNKCLFSAQSSLGILHYSMCFFHTIFFPNEFINKLIQAFIDSLLKKTAKQSPFQMKYNVYIKQENKSKMCR